MKNTRRAGPASLAPVSSPLALLLRLAERFWPSRPANSSSAASSARSPRLVSLGIRKPLWYQRLGGRSSSSSRSSVGFLACAFGLQLGKQVGGGPHQIELQGLDQLFADRALAGLAGLGTEKTRAALTPACLGPNGLGRMERCRAHRLMRAVSPLATPTRHWPQLIGAAADAMGFDAVADVRSMPYSRRLPQFNRPSWKPSCQGRASRYVFLGEELGARREEPDGIRRPAGCLRAGGRSLPAFQRGLGAGDHGAEQRADTGSAVCGTGSPDLPSGHPGEPAPAGPWGGGGAHPWRWVAGEPSSAGAAHASGAAAASACWKPSEVQVQLDLLGGDPFNPSAEAQQRSFAGEGLPASRASASLTPSPSWLPETPWERRSSCITIGFTKKNAKQFF